MRVTSRASAILLALGVAAATACGPRQVEVRTAPTTTTEQAVQVTNNLSQAVNVYVTGASSSEMFLKQIPANTAEKVPVQGVASGTAVTFKAVTVDGSRTYQSRNVTLTGLFIWSIP
jgi:ABC-type phosphate transport system substrate-binding protein